MLTIDGEPLTYSNMLTAKGMNRFADKAATFDKRNPQLSHS
jgi:hypothetical protein